LQGGDIPSRDDLKMQELAKVWIKDKNLILTA